MIFICLGSKAGRLHYTHRQPSKHGLELIGKELVTMIGIYGIHIYNIISLYIHNIYIYINIQMVP